MRKLFVFIFMAAVLVGCNNKASNETNNNHEDDEFGHYITTIDGTSFYFKNDANDDNWYIILVNDENKEEDRILIQIRKDFIKPTIELVGTDSIIIKKGVDGTGVSLRSLQSYESPIIVDGSPMSSDLMECNSFFIPGCVANREYSKLEATIYRLPDISQQQLAPIVYRKIRFLTDNDENPPLMTTVYDAVYKAACKHFNLLFEEEYTSTNEYLILPVWENKKYKMFTNLCYHCYRGEGMLYYVYLSYDTYKNGSDKVLEFHDIFKDDSDQKVADLLNVKIDELFMIETGDGPMKVCYGLTREGVAASFNYWADGPVNKLLKYEDIKMLLRPNILEAVSN